MRCERGRKQRRTNARSSSLILAQGIESPNIFLTSRAPLRSSSMQMGPLPGGVLPGVCAAVGGRGAFIHTLLPSGR